VAPDLATSPMHCGRCASAGLVQSACGLVVLIPLEAQAVRRSARKHGRSPPPVRVPADGAPTDTAILFYDPPVRVSADGAPTDTAIFFYDVLLYNLLTRGGRGLSNPRRGGVTPRGG
jgi:hypothetical protein